MEPVELGNYRLIARLGRGGMADVFLAARGGVAGFAKLVVIKRLRDDLATQPSARRFRALLLDEARLAARLQHPHIVQTFEVSEHAGEPFLAMEYLDGQPLGHVVRAARRAHIELPQDLALRAMAHVLSALAYAHDLADYSGAPLRVVHRDVSPQNIFWTYEGEIKLMDFGVAKFALGSEETQAGHIKGKLAYMAPEQARGLATDRRTDLFAAGIVLWELLAGERLFRAPNDAAGIQRLLYEPIPSLASATPEIDPAIAAIVDRSLAREPDARYQTAGAMRDDLERVLAGRVRREDLAAFVAPLFDAERTDVSGQIRRALSGDEAAAAALARDDASGELEIEPDPTEHATVPGRWSSAAPPADAVAEVPAPIAPRDRRRTIAIGLGAAIAAVVAIDVAWGWQRHGGEPAPVVASAPIAPVAAPVVAATVKPPALRLCGSNTVGAELGPALVEAYLQKKGAGAVTRAIGAHPQEVSLTAARDGLVVDLRAQGTATAFEGLAAGDCDIGMASRAINDKEVAALSGKGYGDLRSPATEHVIALDGIAVIVHPNNPLRALDRTALHDIFTGKVTDWSAVGGAAGPITVLARDDKSGTFDTFKNLVLGKEGVPAGTRRFAQSDELADAVASDPSAIGFIGLAYVRSAKALAVGAPGAPAMLPTSFTVTTEGYLLARRLYFYTTPKPSTPLVAELVSFALSTPGQQVVQRAGFIDLDVTLAPAATCTAACPPRYAALVAHAQRLSLDFRFRAGSDVLDSRATRDLDRIVQFLGAHPHANLYLFGFSDSVGTPTQNAKLSRDRASAIAAELATRGIRPSVVDGFGAALPIAPNTTDSDRERNRRVEVWLAP